MAPSRRYLAARLQDVPGLASTGNTSNVSSGTASSVPTGTASSVSTGTASTVPTGTTSNESSGNTSNGPAVEVPVTKATAPMSVESSASAGARHLREQVAKGIGTREKPWLAAQLWQAVMGVTAAPDVREAVRRVRARSAEHNEIVALFCAAGEGVTPPCLVPPEANIARCGARIVLMELNQAVFAASLRAAPGNHDVGQIMSAISTVVNEDGLAALGSNLVVFSRSQVLAQNNNSNNNSNNVNNNKFNGSRFVKCFKCGQNGHTSNHCFGKRPR